MSICVSLIVVLTMVMACQAFQKVGLFSFIWYQTD